VPRPRFSSWYLDYEQHGYLFDNIAPVDPAGLGRVNPWLQTLGFTVSNPVAAATPPSIDPALFNQLP
jgi:hypothetical protein